MTMRRLSYYAGVCLARNYYYHWQSLACQRIKVNVRKDHNTIKGGS